MIPEDENKNTIAPWKLYLTAIAEVFICFYLATFSLGIYFTHSNKNWLMSTVMCILYLSSLIICIKRVFDKFSLAALMLIIPIAPLMILIVVVTMIPLLQMLQ